MSVPDPVGSANIGQVHNIGTMQKNVQWLPTVLQAQFNIVFKTQNAFRPNCLKGHISHFELAMAVRSAGKVYLNMPVIEANLITWEIAFSCIVPMNTFCWELLSLCFKISFTSLTRLSVTNFNTYCIFFSFILIYIIAIFIPLQKQYICKINKITTVL